MIYFLTYPFLFTLFRLLVRVFGRLRSMGEENVPVTGGFIYCPNHLTDADPPTVFVTIPRRAWFIGKQELFDVPVIGWFWHHFHAFPIKRDSADRAALKRAEQCLRRGEPLMIFPEGRCSRDGKLQRIQPGAALLAIRAGVPIIPIGLEHTNQMLPYGTMVPKFAKEPVTVTFGKPIYPSEFAHLSKSAAIEAMSVRVGEDLAKLTHQAPPPVAPPRVARRKSDAAILETTAEAS